MKFLKFSGALHREKAMMPINEMVALYQSGLTKKAIADLAGVDPKTVGDRLRRAGVQTGRRKREAQEPQREKWQYEGRESELGEGHENDHGVGSAQDS